MRSQNIILLVIVLLILVAGFLFFVVNDSKEAKNKVIDPIKYDKNGSDLIGKELCGGGDKQCQKEFNEYWACDESLDKCVCGVDEDYLVVCGTDGKEYSNPSEANCVGVKVDYNGACVGGGSCEFCQVANCQYGCSCGDENGVGAGCTDQPVCGNGICEENEVWYPTLAPHLTYCPEDCPAENPVCNFCRVADCADGRECVCDSDGTGSCVLIDTTSSCSIDSDCVIKKQSYCCGEETYDYDACYYVGDDPQQVDCKGVGSCPGIFEATSCGCQNNKCVQTNLDV